MRRRSLARPRHLLPMPHHTSLNKTSCAMYFDASVGDGGVASEPQPKGRRTDGEDEYQHDGPVEVEETAREKMEEAGFDPDDVTKECELNVDLLEARGLLEAVGTMMYAPKLHPMTYCCRVGDLKMCRYLLSKGASTTATGTDGTLFPMFAAANGGHLDVCKWLYVHGAEEDIGRRNDDYTPLGFAGSQACCRWFVLKGVLSLGDKPGFVCPKLMRQDFRPRPSTDYDPRTPSTDYDPRTPRTYYDPRPELLEWAKQSVQTQSGFMTFLLGTLPAPAFTRAALQSLLAERLRSQDAAEIFIRNTPEDQCRLAWQKLFQKARFGSPVICFGGTNGILELISDYVGVVRGRDLRILRSLIDPLSAYLEGAAEGE